MIEWPEDAAEPTKYWLSTLPLETSMDHLVKTAKLRWRIERDSQDLKQELGFGHYEGRAWRGFHPPARLCIAAYGFQIALRGMIPPSASARPKKAARNLSFPTVDNPAAPPIRPERHVHNSVATMRRKLTVALVLRLSRCPCCARPKAHRHAFMTQ